MKTLGIFSLSIWGTCLYPGSAIPCLVFINTVICFVT